jgi:protein-L-isoaspartate(D-aspartate) O-methyltransferase
MDYAAARKNMVECQVRTNKVIDPKVVAALLDVPREAFVPARQMSIAYIDEDIQVAPGRFLLEPMVAARLLQAAEVTAGARVLVAAAGTGYEASLLAAMGAEVTAVDTVEDVLRTTLWASGEGRVKAVVASPVNGLPERGPFDVIVIPGAVPQVPKALLDQLADGGRLVTVIKAAEGVIGTATLFVRANGVVASRPLFDAATPVLPDFVPAAQFVF